MSLSRRIFFGAAATWFGRGVNILMGLLLLPVLFRHLPKEELGVWLLLGQSWATLGILDLGFGVTLTRRIAFAKGRNGADPDAGLQEKIQREIADLVATGLLVHRVLALLALAVSFCLGFFYLRTLGLNSAMLSTAWMAWGILCVSQALNVWASPWTSLLQGVGYVGWDSILVSLVNSLTCGIQIAIAFSGGGLVGLAVAAALGAMTQRAVILGFARKKRPELFKLQGFPSTAVIREMLPFALRAWLTGLGYVMVANTDQFFIASLEGAREMPAYRAAFILLINLHFVSGVFTGASQVFVSHLWQEGDLEKIRMLLRRNALIGLLFMGCGGAAIVGLGPVLFDLWLGPGNFIGYPILLVFLATFVIEHHANVFASVGRATEDEAYAWTSVGAGLLKIPLAYFGIQMFGLLGLASSTLLAQAFTTSWFMVYRSARRVHVQLREHLVQVLFPIFVFFALTLGVALMLCQIMQNLPAVVQTSVVVLVSGTILGSAGLVLVLKRSGRDSLLRLLRRR